MDLISQLMVSMTLLQELSHHYSQMFPESKLELHIYSTVLLHCLQHVNGFEVQISGISIAQVAFLSIFTCVCVCVCEEEKKGRCMT